MNGIHRILCRFVITTIFISTLLLILNLVLLGTLVFRDYQNPSPRSVAKEVVQGLSRHGDSYHLDERTTRLLRHKQAWAMLLSKDGHIQWSYQLPDDIPRSYNLVEIAKFSRYYLMEYPVYSWEYGDGLLVVGYPKKSHWKYQFNYPSEWVRSLPQRFVLLLIINVAFPLLISVVMGMRLIKEIRSLVDSIHDLPKNQSVRLNPKGIFSDLAQSINSTSDKLQKNKFALKEKDQARSNWIAGISHDIRTPLSMIIGYASEWENNADLTEEQRQQAGIIRRQGEKLGSLVSDLNLVSMLEYEMQPLQLKPIRLSVLVRQVVADFLNNGLDDRYDIEWKLSNEEIKIYGDEKLLLRAINNLVQNSIRHNPQGCHISLETSLSEDGSKYRLIIKDSGRGISEEQLKDITELPYSASRAVRVQDGHGLGIPMVARIMKAHRGRLVLESGADQRGLKAVMEFFVQNNGDSV